MGQKGTIGVGQGSLDTYDLGITQNGSTNYPCVSALGGNLCTSVTTYNPVSSNVAMPVGAWLKSHCAYTLHNLMTHVFADGTGKAGAAWTALGSPSSGVPRTNDIQFFVCDDVGDQKGGLNLYFKSYANNGDASYPVYQAYFDNVNETTVLVGDHVAFASCIYGNGMAAGGGIPTQGVAAVGNGYAGYGGQFGVINLLMQSDHPGGVSVPWASNPQSKTSPDIGSGTYASRYIMPCGASGVTSDVGSSTALVMQAGVWDSFQLQMFTADSVTPAKTHYLDAVVEPAYNTGVSPLSGDDHPHLVWTDAQAAGLVDGDTNETTILFAELACMNLYGQSGIGVQSYQCVGSRFTPGRPNSTPMMACGSNNGTNGSSTTPYFLTCGYTQTRPGAGGYTSGPTEGTTNACSAGVVECLGVIVKTASSGSPVATVHIGSGAERPTNAHVSIPGTSATISYDPDHEDTLLFGDPYWVEFPSPAGFPTGWTLGGVGFASVTADGTGGLGLGL